jgi:hypothetical protein
MNVLAVVLHSRAAHPNEFEEHGDTDRERMAELAEAGIAGCNGIFPNAGAERAIVSEWAQGDHCSKP